MKEAFLLAATQIKEQLGEMSFDRCEDVVFVGKSIGTALAAYFDSELEIGAEPFPFGTPPHPYRFVIDEDTMVPIMEVYNYDDNGEEY